MSLMKAHLISRSDIKTLPIDISVFKKIIKQKTLLTMYRSFQHGLEFVIYVQLKKRGHLLQCYGANLSYTYIYIYIYVRSILVN